jgi:hypothetical protein
VAATSRSRRPTGAEEVPLQDATGLDTQPPTTDTHHMGVTPLPRRGGVHLDRAHPGSTLRISGHPERGVVIVSIWRGDYCVITHEVPVAEVPDVIQTLAQALVPVPAGSVAASAS